MARDHRRAEGLAGVGTAIPPSHVLNVLRYPKHTVDGGCRQHGRVGVSRKCQPLWYELDSLTGGRPALTGRGDRLTLWRVFSGRRYAGCGLGGASGQQRQQADHTDGTTQSRSTPLGAPDPGLPNWSRQRAMFTSNDGLSPTA